MKAFNARSRVLVVGLDGATFRLLRPWLQRRQLPCLSRLYREGVHATLQSVVPPLSPEAWTTFVTGKHPGHHGIMNFLRFRPGSYELEMNTGASRRAKSLWRLLSDAGRRVGIVGVPMTYPPEPVNGYLLAGFETPGVQSEFTHPPGLYKELRKAVGGFDLHGDFLGRTRPEVYVKRVLETVDNQARAICYLLEHYPADLSVAVIGATDRVQHYFWKFCDATHARHDPKAPSVLAEAPRQVYERADAAIAAMMNRVPDPKTVIVMSDHGFGPCHKLVHLNRWLEAKGYLARATGSARSHSLTRSVWLGIRKYMPRWLKDWVKSHLPSMRRQVESFLILSRIDWSRTRAFSLSTQYGYIYIHSRARFPRGVVANGGEMEQVVAELRAELQQLRDSDTGEPIVEAVHRVRDLYPGSENAYLPDLIVIWREGYVSRTDAHEHAPGQASTGFTESNLQVGDLGDLISVEQSGSHRPDGILIAHGPHIAAPGALDRASVMDLAPTILHLLGEPVPSDMNGRVLEEMLRPDFMATHPVRYCEPGETGTERGAGSPYTEREAWEVAQRLRDLGYME